MIAANFCWFSTQSLSWSLPLDENNKAGQLIFPSSPTVFALFRTSAASLTQHILNVFLFFRSACCLISSSDNERLFSEVSTLASFSVLRTFIRRTVFLISFSVQTLNDRGVAISIPTMADTSSGYFCFHLMASRPDMEWGASIYGPCSPRAASACLCTETSVSISLGESQISEYPYPNFSITMTLRSRSSFS